MGKRTCAAEGCDSETAAREMCRKHYMQWWWKNRRPVSSDYRGIKRSKGVRLKTAVPKWCEQCSIAFEKPLNVTYKEWAKRRFCSTACAVKGRKGLSLVDLTCLQCGILFKVEEYRGDEAKFCGHPCASTFRNQGATSAEKAIRHSAAYKRWRTAVFERDNYTCQECGTRGGELNADHIKPFAFFPDLRFDVDNGRTLCVPCHRATDTYGPRVHRLGFG